MDGSRRPLLEKFMSPTVANQIEEMKEMLTEVLQDRPQSCEKTAEFAEITDKIAEVTKAQAVIIGQLKVVSDTNEKVVNTIYGNGKPGLVTILSETRKDVDGILGVARTALFTLLGLGITAVFYLVLSHGIVK